MKFFRITILFILLFSFYIANAQNPPDSGLGATAKAHYDMAIDSLNGERFIDAAMHFQQILNWFPDSEYARPAKDMNTIIYRLHVALPADNRAYSVDSSYRGLVAELDEPTGMSIDGQQNIYLTDKGKKSLVTFDPTGKQLKTVSILSPYTVFIDQQDRPWIADDENVISGSETISFSMTDAKGNPQQVEQIRSVTVDHGGRYFVVSGKVDGILVFDQNKTFQKTITQLDKQYFKVLVNARNQLCALDKDRKQITVFDENGQVLFSIGPSGKGYTLEKVEDFAVDPANHVYLLEKSPRSILMFSPSGSLMKYLLSDKKGPLLFDDARLISVGSSGAVYVLDKDSHRIIKIG